MESKAVFFFRGSRCFSLGIIQLNWVPLPFPMTHAIHGTCLALRLVYLSYQIHGSVKIPSMDGLG